MKVKKYAIIVAILLLIPLIYADAPANLVYKMNFDIYKNDTVVLRSFDVLEGNVSHFPSSPKTYGVSVFSGPQELFSEGMEISFYVMLDPPITDFSLIKQNVEIRLPYYRTADEIKIYHFESEISSVDLKEQICNMDGICDLGENDYNCKADCGKKGGLWLILLAIPAILALIFVIKKISTRNKLKQENQNMNSENEQRRSF
jgi:hypothetical protein